MPDARVCDLVTAHDAEVLQAQQFANMVFQRCVRDSSPASNCPGCGLSAGLYLQHAAWAGLPE